ncbi:6-bladed beta-propeller [Parabacteroides sp. AM08-6]|uniref:6-bladed beta-propeller n=1 Tax=Parabacteroides sp. AM08-6 TaxID=2292053 RepID=UPI000EFEDB48|nr:6-bladed beta-propeller [Parabacteroides sp. AM08-6]RHJ85328.1 6-bladed beta-propeller [Parabacteroides sp. AM08-6]
MKLLFFSLCVFPLSVSLSAKDNNQKASKENVIKISTINSEKNPLDRGKAFQYEDVKIVPLETNQECLLTFLVEIFLTDEYIFVADPDSKEIGNDLYVFERATGKFLHKIGERGGGPAEYVAFNNFFYDKNKKTITLIDFHQNVFLTYGYDGKFKERKKYSPELMENVENMIILNDQKVFMKYFINKKENDAYVLFDKNRTMVFAKKSYNPIQTLSLSAGYGESIVKVNDDRVNFIMPLCDTIFSCYKGKFMPMYVVGHQAKNIPREKFIIGEGESFFQKSIGYLQKGYFTGFTNYKETNDYILLSGLSGNCLINKQKTKGVYFSNEATNESRLVKSVQDIPFKASLKGIMGCDNDYFVGVADPIVLLNLKISPDTKDPVVQKLKEVVNNLQEDDNPVLIFYKLKDHFDEK